MSNHGIDSERLVALFRALADPTRLCIFEAVRRHCCVAEGRSANLGSFHVGDVYALVDVAPSTVSHHLAALKECGLLTAERCGTFHYLTVGDQAVEALARFAAGAEPEPSAEVQPARARKKRVGKKGGCS